MKKRALNKFNAPEMLGALFTALEVAGLADVVAELRQKKVPQMVEQAWRNRSKKMSNLSRRVATRWQRKKQAANSPMFISRFDLKKAEAAGGGPTDGFYVWGTLHAFQMTNAGGGGKPKQDFNIKKVLVWPSPVVRDGFEVWIKDRDRIGIFPAAMLEYGLRMFGLEGLEEAAS